MQKLARLIKIEETEQRKEAAKALYEDIHSQVTGKMKVVPLYKITGQMKNETEEARMN